MNYRVFFAFQMDIDTKYGKGFIQSAIEMAIEQFKKDKITLSLDFGFRNTPGTPLLIDEMLKKSSEADIVIVDLSFTSSKNWVDAKKYKLFGKEIRVLNNVQDKKSPNPNVLLETGYAWAQKGTYRTLVVMNEAFGTADMLPVDLKGFRWGITYHLDEQSYSERKNKRKDLANDIYRAIKLSIKSEPEYQREKWKPIMLRMNWKSQDFQNIYHPTNQIKSIIVQLREALENPANTQRIIGPKNSGKTRLAYELYNEIGNSLPKHENAVHVLYYDMEFGSFAAIEDKIQDLQAANQKKILIVDNCPYKLHTKISDYLLDTQVSLLTIGNESDGGMANFSLSRSFADEIIENISNETGNPENTTLILNTADGNLRSAIALINSFQADKTELPDEYLARWTQIIGQQLIDNRALDILESLSLFTHVGYTERFQDQSDFIIKQAGIESRQSYENLVSQLAQKGIIKVTGDFVALEAFVEELVNKRLERLQNEDVNAFLEDVAVYKLSKQFSNRIIGLSTTKNFKSITETLSHQDSILRSLEFINSDQGARILMNLAEIVPVLILDVLSKALNTKSYEQLELLNDGRRYLVWSLERLVFRKETFHGAAKLLFRLAVAENENIGNNATAQFVQLFQIGLPGTVVSLETRLALLNEIIHDHLSEPEQSVLLRAMDSALRVRGFTRMGSADKQGNNTFQDYQPKTKEEVDIYWGGIIKLLVEHNGQIILIGRLSDQLYYGNQSAIIDAVEQIVETDQTIGKELRQQFDHFLNDKDTPPKIAEKIQVFIDKYVRKNTRNQLEYLVAIPPYLNYKDEQGRWMNKSEEKAIEFASQLLESNDEQWLKDIDVLLKDEQRMSFSFGKYVGAHKENWEELVITIITQLLSISSDHQNIIFLEGYLVSATNQDFIRWTIDQLLAEKLIAHHAIKLSRLLKLEKNDLEKLYPLIEENPRLSILMQSLSIKNLTEEEIKQFFDKLRNAMPYGAWVAIEIATSGTNGEHISTAIIKELLQMPGILKGEGIYSPLSFHDYIELLKKLDQQGLDAEFVSFLSNEIIEASQEISVHEFHLKEIIDILFSNYWDIAWSIIATKFQDQNFWGWYNLKSILRLYRGYNADALIGWMDKHPDSAPQRIIEIIDWTVSDNGLVTLSPLVMQMLDKYTYNKTMLDYFSSMLHSYSWSGSVIPLLESRRNIIQPLLQHPKPEIRDFAQQNTDYFTANIKREKRNELNESLDD